MKVGQGGGLRNLRPQPCPVNTVSNTNNWRLRIQLAPDFVGVITLTVSSYQISVKNPDCE